ncbi:MAG: hypothetical protein KDC53_20670 [Saprospiraceae bacterium]|nr:hypothetical protein [Saprospiraceae bacterium]
MGNTTYAVRALFYEGQVTSPMAQPAFSGFRTGTVKGQVGLKRLIFS